MLDKTTLTILRSIFVKSTTATGVKAQRFRATFHEHLDLIDSLVSSGYIENRDGNYSLSLTTLPELKDSTPQVESTLYLCDHLFSVLRQEYLDYPGETISLDNLSKLADLPKQQINIAIPYLSASYVLGGFSADLTASDAYVIPTEKLLRHQSFSEVIEDMRSWPSKASAIQRDKTPWPRIFSSPDDELAFEQLLHPAICEHALPQYKNGHLRDAVLNSITAIFDLIRKRTGLTEDGNRLIGKVFSIEKPYLKLSELDSESGRNDQQGFMQIFMGVYQGIRNPKAHSLEHDLTSINAAQYLVLASLLARRVEEGEAIKYD